MADRLLIESNPTLYRAARELRLFLDHSETIVSSVLRLAVGRTLEELSEEVLIRLVNAALFGAPINTSLWTELAGGTLTEHLQLTTGVMRTASRGLLERNLAGALADELVKQRVQRMAVSSVKSMTGRIDDSSRLAVGTYAQSLAERDVPPRRIASLVRNAIGLDERWAKALDTQYAATETNRELKRSVKDRITASYADKARESRFKTLARTELSGLASRANLELMSDVEDRVWLTAADERVCKTCRPLDKKRIAPGEAFARVGEIEIFAPPAHVNCRCMVIPAVWLDDARGAIARFEVRSAA
jgi:SPP1 gp7 family putative phage head morphogenesis protein